MTNNTIGPTASNAGLPTPTQLPEPGQQQTVAQPRSRAAGSPLPLERNAGSAPLGRRMSLSCLPRMAQQAQSEPSDSAAGDLVASRAQIINAAIAMARSEADFAAVDRQARRLPAAELAQAGCALADRFLAEVQARCRLREKLPEGDYAKPLGEDVFRISDAVCKYLADLPRSADHHDAFARMTESILSSQSSMVEHTNQYLVVGSSAARNAEHARLRDTAQVDHVSRRLLDITKAMKTRGIVHDPAAMRYAIDCFLGPKSTVFSAQTAISELPQLALDLSTPQGDDQAVEMMTQLAEGAMRNAGVTLLQSDPGWASYLKTDRIDIVLERKNIDINAPANEGLKNALAHLERAGQGSAMV